MAFFDDMLPGTKAPERDIRAVQGGAVHIEREFRTVVIWGIVNDVTFRLSIPDDPPEDAVDEVVNRFVRCLNEAPI